MVKMDMTALINLIQGVGFPIGVTVFLLVYMKKEMEENRNALYELRLVITSLHEFIRGKVKENGQKGF